MPTASIKLQSYIAHAGITSRRKAEELISSGQVSVNGQPAHIGQRVTPNQDVVAVNGQVLASAVQPELYLIHKPVGVISTTHDELGRTTVVDFLQQQVGKTVRLPRLYPVGRLDQDSEGLVILTNDGQLAQKLTHPSYETHKVYTVTVEGQPTSKALAHLERGVLLREGMTAPAEAHVLNTSPTETVIELTIHEGRYHQVKRMFLRIGYPVTHLLRRQIGPYSLDQLEGRAWRKVPFTID